MELTPAEHAARDAAAERDAGLTRAERKRSGIVHTPPELARFVARAADALVKQTLDLAHGLADARVAVIDPACGPGAFLAAAAAVSAQHGARSIAMRGFDRDAAAIAAARAVLQPLLGDTCVLERRDTLVDLRPAPIARIAPALCVLGNPPWVASAQAAPAPYLQALLEDFRRDAGGERVPERKLGVLADAYVRFLRWACEVARCAEQGAVLAFVTNASYLDGPVHRMLRAALRRWFSNMHIVDLGGSALLARGRARDDNVFGVRPSVAILLATRRAGHDESALAPVRYCRVPGALAHKLELLAHAQLDDLSWRTLLPEAAHHRFVPTVASGSAYARAVSLAEAMPFQREGVQTNRDGVVIDTDREQLFARMRAFARGKNRADLAAAWTALPHYDPERARLAVQGALERDPDGSRGLLVRRIAYRPFDTRWFVPVAPLCHRPRAALLAAVDHAAFSLVSVRKDRGELAWAHVSAARDAIDNCLLSTRSSCRARAFPTTDPHGNDNLAPPLAARWQSHLGRRVTASDFAHYALAIMSSPQHRARNDQALRIDYPRIPEPRTASEFEAFRSAGAHLVELLCAPLLAYDADEHEAPCAQPIEIDRAHGEVRLGGVLVCGMTPAALGLRIGHHLPLLDRVRAGRSHGLSAGRLRALCARLDALATFAAALPEPPA